MSGNLTSNQQSKPCQVRMRLAGWAVICCFSAVLAWLPMALGFDFERLKVALLARFGPERVGMLEKWQRVLIAAMPLPESEKLLRINDFFNNNFLFIDDMVVWQQADYWATPLELIGQGRGDCEDMAIAKYYSLKASGVAVEKLRLVYVKARTNGANGPSVQAHMVLAYYPAPTAEPLVLDRSAPICSLFSVSTAKPSGAAWPPIPRAVMVPGN
jgi:predicted transglutaminase-like cysteine proteinase